MKIGLALSGGGFRATVFHLGVLARLAVDEQDLFSQVTHLSTVSGGSLCAGLIYALSNNAWPTREHYLQTVLPRAREILTGKGLDWGMAREVLLHPWMIVQARAHDLSRLLQNDWGITAPLKKIPAKPHWTINACCHETGKKFTFEPNTRESGYEMNDYILGHASVGDLILSDALAASSAFPGIINYFEIHAERYWPRLGDNLKTLHLWDGGAYDNLGLEELMDIDTGWRHQIDFLLASCASAKADVQPYRWFVPGIYRMVTGIMMEQVNSLRKRIFVSYLRHNCWGNFFQIGNTCEYTLRGAKFSRDEVAILSARCLNQAQVEQVAHTPTGISKLLPEAYENLFRHGYEVADYTLYAYHSKPNAQPSQFKFIGYDALNS